jgi:hypothetical protein
VVLWSVSWSGRVVATGTGPVPYELRERVREGLLKCEVSHRAAPRQVTAWRTPDWHFMKMVTLCLMVFGATVVLIRERIAQLELESEPGVLVFDPRPPRPVAWSSPEAWRPRRITQPLPSAMLARIHGFADKAKALRKARPVPEPAQFGLLAVLRAADEPADLVLTGTAIEGGVAGGVVGGVVGGDAARERELSVHVADREALRELRSLHVTGCIDPLDDIVETTFSVRADGTVSGVAVNGVSGWKRDCLLKRVAPARFAPSADARTLTARWNAG